MLMPSVTYRLILSIISLSWRLFQHSLPPLCSWHVEPTSLWWPQLSLWRPPEWSASCRMHISHHLFALFIILQMWLCWKEDLHSFPYIFRRGRTRARKKVCVCGKVLLAYRRTHICFSSSDPFFKGHLCAGLLEWFPIHFHCKTHWYLWEEPFSTSVRQSSCPTLLRRTPSKNVFQPVQVGLKECVYLPWFCVCWLSPW